MTGFQQEHPSKEPRSPEVPEPIEGLPDEELVSAHLDGRPGAFRELHDRYRHRLSHFILRKTGNPERVPDLLQDTWVRVARHLHRFDTGRNFSTWVFTIAANLCKNELRNRARARVIPFRYLESQRSGDREGVQFEDYTRTPDRLFQRRELQRLVEDAVGRLSEDHQRVFHLREIRGFSYREVAGILGIRLGTVKSRLHRARTDFATRIGPLFRDLPSSEDPDP
jgi:RNA polymerase sigma-70 factor (ECF subfamily)